MGKRKKWLALALCAVLLVTPAAAVNGGGTAQIVDVDGWTVFFYMYTDYDAQGYATNYVKLRDVAWVLKDSYVHFSVDYDGSTRVDSGGEYWPAGGEMTPVPDGATAQRYRAVVTVNGEGCPMDAYFITPPGSTSGNFYFKLRDLGAAIGFTVGWSPERGVYIDTV